MKSLISIVLSGLLLASTTSYASYIICYMDGKLIYKGGASHIWIGKDYIDFVNYKNKRIHLPAKCIIKSDNAETWG